MDQQVIHRLLQDGGLLVYFALLPGKRLAEAGELAHRPGDDVARGEQGAGDAGNFQQGQQFREGALKGLVVLRVVEKITLINAHGGGGGGFHL